MNQGNLAVTIQMGMSVGFGHSTMSCPPGMPHANMSGRQLDFMMTNLSHLFFNLEASISPHRHAASLIPLLLKILQAAQNQLCHGFFVATRTKDFTHTTSLQPQFNAGVYHKFYACLLHIARL